MGKYTLSRAARGDLREVKNYMAEYSLDAASRFLDAFEEKCRQLANFPEMGLRVKNWLLTCVVYLSISM